MTKRWVFAVISPRGGVAKELGQLKASVADGNLSSAQLGTVLSHTRHGLHLTRKGVSWWVNAFQHGGFHPVLAKSAYQVTVVLERNHSFVPTAQPRTERAGYA